MPKEYRKDYWFIDLLGALVCGLLIGALQDYRSHSGDEISFANFIRTVLAAVGCYSISALLLLALKEHPFIVLPKWVLIVVLGPAVYYSYIHLVVDTGGSFDWWFCVGLFVITITDSLIALPVMAAIHYLGSKLLRALRVREAHAA